LTKRDFFQAAVSTGFHNVKIVRNSYKHTFNIEFYSIKSRKLASDREWATGVKKFLNNFLVDESEKELLELWMTDFHKNIGRKL